MDWWINEKEKSGVVDNRPKCWYGKNCRTQGHNPDHAARLNHACHEIPVGDRYVRAPRRIPPAQQRPPLGGAGPARRASPPPPSRVVPLVLDPPVGVPVLSTAQPVTEVNASEVAVAAAVTAAEEANIPTPGAWPRPVVTTPEGFNAPTPPGPPDGL